MKIVVKLASACLALAGVCHAVASEWEFSVNKGNSHIRLCQEAHLRGVERPISDEVDRAYVYSRHDVSWILFARGELGSFGNPDPSYGTFVRCTVATQPLAHVQELIENPRNVIVREEMTYEDFHHPDESFVESLYLREGERFIHVGSQVNSLCWMKKLDWLIPPPGHLGMKLTPCPDS